MKPLLDAREVGALLKLSPQTVYTKAWRRRVGLPAIESVAFSASAPKTLSVSSANAGRAWAMNDPRR